jgi:pantoate kinase
MSIPLHISGFWKPIETSTPLTTGSIGAGITVSPCVRVSEGRKCELEVNDVCIDLRLTKIINDYLKLDDLPMVRIESPVNLGEGFGLSAAIAIAYSTFALRKIGSNITINEVGKLAHISEVVNRTGLGDVIAEIRGGGLVIRTKPGPPGIGDIDVIPIPHSVALATVLIGKMHTPEMLERFKYSISSEGLRSYINFIREPTIENFVQEAHRFSLATGMLTRDLDARIKDLLRNNIKSGCVIGYFVKKSLLVVIHDEACSDDIKSNLDTLGNTRVFKPYQGCTTLVE